MFDKCEVSREENVEPLKELVFVYGSLKAGFGNHGVLKRSNCVFVANDNTDEKYTMISLTGFPGVLHNGLTSISGEVYEVDRLDGLDSLEGHPHFYKREQITTKGGRNVWMYILNREHYSYDERNKIDTGIWEKR